MTELKYYTMYEANIIHLAQEFSKDPCQRTLHNLVTLARMNDLTGFATLKVGSSLSDEWIEKLFAGLWPPGEVEKRMP